MNEDEARFIRVSIGMLARQVRELVTYVGALTAILEAGPDSEETAALVEELEKGLLDLETSVLRVADAFPEEFPEVETATNE